MNANLRATRDETVWTRGRFDTRRAPSEVLFGRMYEDASIELAAFRRGARVFCIASAGDTAMQLAWEHDVVAVDVNPAQLAYAERRAQGAPSARGAAERMMQLGRTLGPLWGWRTSRLHAFLELDDPNEQLAFWREHLDTRRFRIAFDAAFSASVLRLRYSLPFVDFLPRRFGAVMRARMERCFARHPNRTNVFARALFLGEMSPSPPLDSVQRIRWVHDDAATFLENSLPGSFDAFTLSNILDGAAPTYAERLFTAVRRASSDDAVVVLRSFAEPTAALATNRAADDRAILWGIVDVRAASSLDAGEWNRLARDGSR